MPEKEPGMLVALLTWLRCNQTNFSYAIIAAIFSFLRNVWLRHSWSRRVLDAISCSMLAFFAKPVIDTLQIIFGLTLPKEAPQILAIYIGYVGTNYIRTIIKSTFKKKRRKNEH